jgi:Fe2+ or Zn2+ uptake regulation protein
MHLERRHERLQRFEQACRARGTPVTVQRRAILEAARGPETHPMADDVPGALSEHLPQVSRTTVDRILETLHPMGVIAADSGFEVADFHVTLRGVCRRCREQEDRS